MQMQVPQLCLVTDPAVPDLLARIRQALEAGVTMLQLRCHGLPASYTYELAQALRPLCRQHGALLIINDRIDIAQAVDADGVQLGSRSLPPATARMLIGAQRLLGVSVHSLEQAQAAVEQGADFLIVGTIFVSRSHPDRPAAGSELLHLIRQHAPSLPILGIGGINATNAGQVMDAGASGIAVISAILSAEDIVHSVQQLRRSILQYPQTGRERG